VTKVKQFLEEENFYDGIINEISDSTLFSAVKNFQLKYAGRNFKTLGYYQSYRFMVYNYKKKSQRNKGLFRINIL